LSASNVPELPFVESVLHPSDFSEASESAFAHALALALLRRTRLTILHVGGRGLDRNVWRGFPAVRGTLERWGLLEKGSPRSAVFEELAVRLEKVALKSRNPVDAMLAYLEERPTDLIVLATRAREGTPRWIQRSVSLPLARRSHTMTLFVPEGGRGMVDRANGKLTLSRILVPVDHRPAPHAALQLAERAAMMAEGTTEITLLHVGEKPLPPLELPDDPRWSWNTVHREGKVVDEILAAAEDRAADLIIMVTEGHHGVFDALRGSTTEQVVKKAPCTLLAVPTAWLESVAD
jgi:nucleotide-binding universal stress UspA family protein